VGGLLDRIVLVLRLGAEQYGLVAEEVAKVDPDLVSNDANGRPYTMRYQLLAPMLLNEVQKQARLINDQRRQLSEQTNEMQQQARQIATLTARLTQLEKSSDRSLRSR